jgi:tripeptide aminopeptidase
LENYCHPGEGTEFSGAICMLNQAIGDFLNQQATQRFLRYVTIDTRSDPQSGTRPSTAGQLELARLLAGELAELGLEDILCDENGYLYARLPATPGAFGPAITLCAHLDTSPSESGAHVRPVVHENYSGGVIGFKDRPDLVLSPDISPELSQFTGQAIITASGNTLLGADDKAGIAEIMAALAAWQQFGDLPHSELRIVFTPDEEIGHGVDRIDLARLGQYGYTIDGGQMGEIEDECFDAWEAIVTFSGRNIHPGYAKGRMINAAAIAARFVGALPEHQTPEHTDQREGFWHLTHIGGDENQARIQMILRDFERQNNSARINFLRHLLRGFEMRYGGLKTELIVKDQYSNMRQVLVQYPEVTEKAIQAIQDAGLSVIRKPIRGGTDGARLCFMGLPTPNLFAGGLMFHSKTEWIARSALQKGAEVIIHLCRRWAQDPDPQKKRA